MKIGETCYAVVDEFDRVEEYIGAEFLEIHESKKNADSIAKYESDLRVVPCVIIESAKLDAMKSGSLAGYTICQLLDEILYRIETKTIGIPKSSTNQYYQFHVRHSLNDLDYEKFGNRSRPSAALIESEGGK